MDPTQGGRRLGGKIWRRPAQLAKHHKGGLEAEMNSAGHSPGPGRCNHRRMMDLQGKEWEDRTSPQPGLSVSPGSLRLTSGIRPIPARTSPALIHCWKEGAGPYQEDDSLSMVLNGRPGLVINGGDDRMTEHPGWS